MLLQIDQQRSESTSQAPQFVQTYGTFHEDLLY